MTVFSGRYSRHCFATVFMFVMCISLQGQNLVPNPSFEGTNCPNDINFDSFALPWISPTTASPDLFNICNSLNSENGYAGFYVYAPSTDYRKYIQTILQTPML